MPGLVLDTHTALWYLELNPRLSATALAAIRQALAQGEECLVASISLVETTYLMEKGRIPMSL